MRTSIFTLIFRERGLEETLKLSKEIGYDAVELWGSEPHISAETSAARAKEIRAMLDEYALGLSDIGSYIGNFSTMSDKECQLNYESLEKYLNIMKILRCDLIRVGCGGPNVFCSEEYHFHKALKWMEKCSKLASEYDVRLAMEIHNGSLIETVEAAEHFIKTLNCDNVGFIHDAGNMYITDTDYGIKSVEVLGDRIFHVHVKDELRIKNDSLPGAFHDRTVYGDEIFQQKLLGEGAVDHVPLFKALIKSGYKGYLSSECHAAVPDIERARHDLNEMKKQIAIAEKAIEKDMLGKI